MMKLPLTGLFSRIFIAAVFIFAIYSNVRLIIRNYHLKERVREAKNDVERLDLRNQKLSLLLSYYQSPSYQEVEARRRLGLKKPDEKAYVIKGITLPENNNSELENTIYQEAEVTPAPLPSNISSWWRYFSGNR
mgnify:CR=1 FL=1